jgi:hypothetical protein
VALVGLAGCQEPGEPGPIESAGAQIDHVAGKVTRSIGEFSVRAGEGVDQAGHWVGATAQRAGTGVHDKLVPSEDSATQKAAPDGSRGPVPQRSE